MSKRNRYPELRREQLKLKRCNALHCEQPAIERVEIRQSHMRGDDDVFVLCAEHLDQALREDTVFNQARTIYKLTGNYHGEEGE